jgi:MbtH protein
VAGGFLSEEAPMADQQETKGPVYKVVINHEEQYSIWPQHRANPAGWRDAGKVGSKDECLEYIKQVWTDMRPLSVRQMMQ